jgi:hypothetical protein
MMQRSTTFFIGITVASIAYVSHPGAGRASGHVPAIEPLAAQVGAPAVTTGPAGALSASTATLSGSVGTHGLETKAYFRFGPTAAYGAATAPQPVAAGLEVQPFEAEVSGLRFASTYHYQAVARNAAGEASGSDGTFTTPDAVIGGTYAVRLTIRHGGRAFGQRAGHGVRRSYRFTAHCAAGVCSWLRLRREGAEGTFASVLNRQSGERYIGVERSRGRCDNGERFRARTRIAISPAAESGGYATALAGTLTVRARGCVHAAEVARLTGTRSTP